MRWLFIRLLAIGLTCGIVLGIASCGRAGDPAAPPAPRIELSNEAFLERHWARPLARQQGAAVSPGDPRASLDPAACGACHKAQHEDWRRSAHSRAMGPGVTGQLVTMVAADPASAEDCIRCHAPLAEQAESLASSLRADARAEDRLHEQGLTCASCHLRAGSVYGPPRRDGSAPGAEAAALPHQRWTATRAFEDSRFCASCHQFEADGYALNGKLLENTFEEWKASVHAREGRSCQGCHMPDRRHLWRGIHDPEMVRRALTIDVSGPVRRGGELSAEVRIRNTGAGHHFPTYVTPKVFVEAYQQDVAGAMLPGTLRRHEISRSVSPDLSRELADTRIASGEQILFDYRARRAAAATALTLRLRVEPDAFYRDLYQSLLGTGAAGRGEASIRRALREAATSGFVAYSSTLSLAGGEQAARTESR